MKEYKKELEKEMMQFIFISNKSDVDWLLKPYDKKNLDEYVRLACIVSTFGYKRLLMKIFAIVEKDITKFLNKLDALNGHFETVDGWIVDFIGRMRHPDARKLADELWTDEKSKMKKDKFSIKELVDF